MALVGNGAISFGAEADRLLALIGCRTEVLVIAGRAVRSWVGTQTGVRIADTGVMTCIGDRAIFYESFTDAADAPVSHRTAIAVVAGSVIGSRIGTKAGLGIARSCVMAFIGSRAILGFPDAQAVFTVVGRGAEVIVCAGCAVGAWIGAQTGVRIADTSIMAGIGSRTIDLCADTDAALAGIGPGAEVGVITGSSIRPGVRTKARGRITHTGVVALVGGRTVLRRASADPGRAKIAVCAEILVVALSPVRFHRIGAQSGSRITDACFMAGIGSLTDERRKDTPAILSTSIDGAGVAVVAIGIPLA